MISKKNHFHIGPPRKPQILSGLMLAFVLVALVSPMVQTGSALAQETYKFGIVPQFEARRLAEIWNPILDELERRTGHHFELQGSAKIPVFEKSFIAGEFDFAYMNPYHCLVGMDEQGYKPLVRDGARQLFGILTVRKDSPYQDVKELAGKDISFPAPNALGASLLMRAELVRNFGIDFNPVYSQTHTSSYLNTVLGETEAAGGVMSTFNKQKPEIRDNLRILFETQKMAPHPIVCHPRVPTEISQQVRQALLDMAATEEGQALLSQVPMKKAIGAKVSDYTPLRELGLQDFYVR